MHLPRRRREAGRGPREPPDTPTRTGQTYHTTPGRSCWRPRHLPPPNPHLQHQHSLQPTPPASTSQCVIRTLPVTISLGRPHRCTRAATKNSNQKMHFTLIVPIVPTYSRGTQKHMWLWWRPLQVATFYASNQSRDQ